MTKEELFNYLKVLAEYIIDITDADVWDDLPNEVKRIIGVTR